MIRSIPSQVQIQKSIIAKQLFRNNLFNPFPEKFQKDPIKYINSLRGHGKVILLYRMKHAYFGLTQISQEQVSEDLQIDVRIIQLWDQRFILRGFYLKKQTSMFSRNHFYFNPKLQGSLGYKIRSTFGLIKEDIKVIETKVTPLLEFKLKDIYISHLHLPSVYVSGRVEVKENEMNEQRKRLILSKRNHPKAKEALSNPEIKKTLLPEVIFGLCDAMGWEEEKKVKLAAFDDKVLEDTHNELVLELHNKSSTLKDKFAFFLSRCKKLSTSRGIEPLWQFSHMLAENWEIDLTSYNLIQENKSQDSSFSVKKNTSIQDPYEIFKKQWEREQRNAPRLSESELIELKDKIKNWKNYKKLAMNTYERTGNEIDMRSVKCYQESIDRMIFKYNRWANEPYFDENEPVKKTLQEEIEVFESTRDNPAMVRILGSAVALDGYIDRLIENAKLRHSRQNF